MNDKIIECDAIKSALRDNHLTIVLGVFESVQLPKKEEKALEDAIFKWALMNPAGWNVLASEWVPVYKRRGISRKEKEASS